MITISLLRNGGYVVLTAKGTKPACLFLRSMGLDVISTANAETVLHASKYWHAFQAGRYVCADLLLDAIMETNEELRDNPGSEELQDIMQSKLGDWKAAFGVKFVEVRYAFTVYNGETW